MRTWMAAALAAAIVAGTAGCGSKEPKDELYACVTAVGDSKNFGRDLGAKILAVRDTAESTAHAQAVSEARSLVTDWLSKVKELTGKDISPDLRRTLTDSQATLEQIQRTLTDAKASPPDASGQIATIDGNINGACKGKY